jgi:hypothetical protein
MSGVCVNAKERLRRKDVKSTLSPCAGAAQRNIARRVRDGIPLVWVHKALARRCRDGGVLWRLRGHDARLGEEGGGLAGHPWG